MKDTTSRSTFIMNSESYKIFSYRMNKRKFFGRLCCVLPWDLGKQRGTRIYKNIILYFYSSMVRLVWRSGREFAHTKVLSGIGTFSMLYSLKTPTRLTWPRFFTHAMFFFFIGYDLHPRNACSPLVMAYNHSSFYASGITPTHCLFSGSHFVLSTTECIYQRL